MSLSIVNTGGGGSAKGKYVWKKYSQKSVSGKITPYQDKPLKVKIVSNGDCTIDLSTVELIGIGFDLMKSDGSLNTRLVIVDETTAMSVKSQSTSTYTYDATTGIISFDSSSWSMGGATSINSDDVPCDGYGFDDYVICDDENKYPDNGEKDGFWYVRTHSNIIDGTIHNDGLNLKTNFFDYKKADLPQTLIRGAAVVLNGEIHILGGASTTLKHQKWDGSNWVNVSTLPYSFDDGCAVVLNGEIHILGGDYKYKNHYKWNGTSWVSVSTLPYGVESFSAVVFNGEIHILGGIDATKNHYKWNGTSWVSVSTLPTALYRGHAVVFDGEMHYIGGATKTAHYKWNGSKWVSASTFPYWFEYGAAVVFNGEIHALGADPNEVGQSNAAAYHYKYNGTKWGSVGALPYDFYKGCAVVYENGINIMGGNDGNKNHYSISTKLYSEVTA